MASPCFRAFQIFYNRTKTTSKSFLEDSVRMFLQNFDDGLQDYAVLQTRKPIVWNMY
jgi:hypothetical protein